MVLLAVLQLEEQGYAIAVRRELEQRAGRAVSRGALYRTFDRLEAKGLLTWSLDDETPDRGGHPRRRFRVTDEGIAALRTSRQALFSLWEGLDAVLEGRR
jgi:DNA-binding PadR family transcriptional regulator